MLDFRFKMSEGGGRGRSRCASLASRIFNRHSHISRRGLTLIELLIVMAIIATLSAIFLGASRSAMEAASAARTKSTVNKLNVLLMEKWASYSTRRADVKPGIIKLIEDNFSSDERGRAMAVVRLLAMRELMKFEMPDRWNDITGATIDTPIASSALYPIILENRPALSRSYLNRFQQLDISSVEKINTVRQNQSAECLYLIIMLATGDGEARTMFSPQDIGDTDEDGALEFLDGWGNPIGYIRWPSGFAPISELMTGDADADHDPLDFYRLDWKDSIPSVNQYAGIKKQVKPLNDNNPAYRLVPLIYSRGPDGEGDLLTLPPHIIDDPYIGVDVGGDNFKLGTPFDSEGDHEGWHDNIHNHLLDNR